MDTASHCTAQGCERAIHTRTYNLCLMHYKRLHRTGRLQPPDLKERFWSRVNKNGPNGCWQWEGFINPTTGYGQFSVSHSVLRLAHRISYELAGGSIPDKMVLDHLCRNRACVNPQHLEVVTYQTNLLRGPTSHAAKNAAKTHCPQGHPYDEANTYHIPTGGRACRACAKMRDAIYRHAKKLQR